MEIDFYSFGLTGGVCALLIALVLWATRTSIRRSALVRVMVCTLAALTLAPSPPISVFGHTFVVPAWQVIFLCLFDRDFKPTAVLFGLLPLVVVFSLLYGVWTLLKTRNA